MFQLRLIEAMMGRKSHIYKARYRILRNTPMFKILVYFCVLLYAFLIMGEVRVNAAALLHHDEGGPIPSGYETYTLFLIPDEKWITREKETGLEKLYQDFLQFGDAIGENNLAIWFWKTRKHDEISVPRTRKYCDKFKLPYQGPFIATLSKHPDSNMMPNDYFTLDLKGIASERITNILDFLGNSILSGKLMWDDTLNTSPISLFRFRYPVNAVIKEPIENPKNNLKHVFSKINNLPLEEKKLNVQILFVLLTTLIVSTLMTVKKKNITFRKQKIGASATVFFLGIICYYITYRVIFFEYIGDTLIILILTLIYGLIPQRIVEHIPMMKRIVTYSPS